MRIEETARQEAAAAGLSFAHWDLLQLQQDLSFAADPHLLNAKPHRLRQAANESSALNSSTYSAGRWPTSLTCHSATSYHMQDEIDVMILDWGFLMRLFLPSFLPSTTRISR
ncbi:hypothetical protein ACLOJK_024400 [Asimina triloba]